MLNIQQVCDGAIGAVEGGRGCLVMDLERNRVLAFAKRPDAALSIDEVEQLMRLCGDMFRGPLIRMCAESLRVEDELPGEFVQEAQVTTASGCHFFATIPGWSTAAVVLMVEDSKNLGLSWVTIRNAREQFMEFQPDEVRAALASDLGDAWQQTLQRPPSARASAPAAPQPERAPATVHENQPAAREPKELNARPSRDALRTPEHRSEDPEESTPKVHVAARSQMYRPAEKDNRARAERNRSRENKEKKGNAKARNAKAPLARGRWPRI